MPERKEAVTGENRELETSFREICESIRKGSADFELQLSLARGIYPLEPPERLETLFLLLASREDVLKKEALTTLKKMPRSIIVGVAGDAGVPPLLLEKMVRLYSKQEDILETVLVNPAVDDRTVAFLATLPFPRLLEIIGRNQIRLDREASIIENLKKNPETPRTVLSLWEESQERKRRSEGLPEDESEEEEGSADNLPALLVEEEPEKGEDWEQAREAKKDTVIQLLRNMSAGERVAMAMKGNSEVRKILIRDKNRLICEKVLENPRITESEIESFAKSTNVSEDVLRTIGTNREWSRQLGIVRSLVNNPKTPVGISMGFLKRLTVKDLEFLGKSKNVPETVRRTAKRMHKQKIERRS